MKGIAVAWRGDLAALDTALRQQLGAAFYGLSGGPDGVVAHVEETVQESVIISAVAGTNPWAATFQYQPIKRKGIERKWRAISRE